MEEYSENVAQAAALLGTVFYQDPLSDKGRAAFEWFAVPSAQDAWEFGQPAAGQAVALMREACAASDAQTLHEEYNRLFIGPHRLPAPPWASVYTDPEGVIFGNATLGVRQWMRDNLVKLTLPDNEPEDHFGLMLMMLSWGIANGVDRAALDELLEQHMLPWTTYFLELFCAGAQHDAYVGAARLAAATLADWQQRFQLNPPVINLHRRD